MARRTEYLIQEYDHKTAVKKELRVPKGANLKQLLERLICRELDDDALVASCLRKNSARYFDPFQIIDMRDDHRREQARDAVRTNADTGSSIDIYNDARELDIPPGKTLMMAGVNRNFFIKEVELQ
ncbi:MAG: hypothetical protein ACSHW6_11085 [Sulfitobacter geojensis]